VAIKISIKEVVDAFELMSADVDFFLNVKSGEVRPITQEDRLLLDRDESPDAPSGWERDSLPLIREVFESDDSVELPDQQEIHEWSIMERFCNDQDDAARGELGEAIRGRGAFRAFRDAVFRLGLREAWFAYRRDAFEEIARNWLRAKRIPFE
jgi:hypothetical protein